MTLLLLRLSITNETRIFGHPAGIHFLDNVYGDSSIQLLAISMSVVGDRVSPIKMAANSDCCL